MKKFLKYYNVVTPTISLLLSLYLSYNIYNLYEMIELIDLLQYQKNILDNKVDYSNTNQDNNGYLLTHNQKIYLCIGIIVLCIGVYYYFSLNDITTINDVTTINNLTSINIKTEPVIENERLKDFVEYLVNVSNELHNNLIQSNHDQDDLINDLEKIIKNA